MHFAKAATCQAAEVSEVEVEDIGVGRGYISQAVRG